VTHSEALVVLENVTSREAPVALAPATFSLGIGAHALVGTREDAVGLVLATIAGRVRARSGSVRVLGATPHDLRVRKAIAHVGREVALPEVMRVGEVLEMAAAVRGEPIGDPRVRLERLGIAELLPRRVRTLLPAEARAVALAEALTSTAKIVLLDEPYVDVDPRAASRLAAAVGARAVDGCVVVATASLREAAELADDHLLFERGRFVHRTTALSDVIARGAGPARLRAIVEDPRTLLAALAAETAPVSIEAGPRSVTVSGPDVLALADAVARAALRANVEIVSLRAEAPPLEELRASIAGDAAAAYRAATERHAPPAPPPASFAPPPPLPPAQPSPPPPVEGGPA
jgi:ABC-type multidrug transport system ATPase subunit